MMQFLGNPAADSLIVRVDALLEDPIPEFLEHQKEDVETMITASVPCCWIGEALAKGTSA